MSGIYACVCGHAVEEHDHECSECDCVHYEEDEEPDDAP
jgi:hypothetical protein